MKEGKHIIFLDYVRIVACLMVMLVHASENFYGADPTVGMAGNVSMLANESNRFWVAFYHRSSPSSCSIHCCRCYGAE